VLENEVPRKLFGPNKEVLGKWNELRNGEVHNLYSVVSIIKVIKLRWMRWTVCVARMRNMINTNTFAGKWTLLSVRRRINIKRYLRQAECVIVGCI
jgi:hypothetical protein